MGNFISQIAPYQRGTAVAFAVGLAAVAHFLPSESQTSSALVRLGHLGSFSLWFGMQFWVTFVAGLTKMKILPRHWFGKVQQALFHKYLSGGMILNGIMLSTFMVENPFSSWENETKIMGVSLVSSCVLTTLNCLIIEPVISEIIDEMHGYEKEKGHGQEIGAIKEGEILNDPKYISYRKNFLKYHGISTISNLACFTVSGVHLWFLSKRIQF